MKTDWKDDVFEQRKYIMTNNDDGTVSLEDATEYSQAGDAFGAKELNEIGEEVNRAKDTVLVTLNAADWTGSAAPYSQTVTASSITADDEPILVKALTDGATAAVQKAYNKAFGIISSGTATTADGNVTFKVYKKPATDILVGLKGV